MKHILNLDRSRELRYNITSFVFIQKLTGIKVMEKLEDLLDIDFSYYPAIAWAGLIWDDPGLTVEQVEKFILDKTQGNEIAMGKIAFTVLEAIAAFPETLGKKVKFRIPGRKKSLTKLKI